MRAASASETYRPRNGSPPGAFPAGAAPNVATAAWTALASSASSRARIRLNASLSFISTLGRRVERRHQAPHQWLSKQARAVSLWRDGEDVAFWLDAKQDVAFKAHVG